jgi:hypothetical protein
MANISITPSTVLLTCGQAATFQATGADAVTWSLNPQLGNLVPLPGENKTTSVTYVAPPVTNTLIIAIVASTASDSAGATIFLTPDAIAVLPAMVRLRAGEEQQFAKIVAGAHAAAETEVPTEPITWILSPPLGKLDEKTGLYKAPPEISDTATVTVTAASLGTGKQGVARVNLIAPPWTGLGVRLLGVFISLVFLLVILIVLLWPPALPSPDLAKADRIEAEKTLEETTTALEQAQAAAAKAESDLNKAGAADKGQPGPSATPQEQDAKAAALGAQDRLERARKAQEAATDELKDRRTVEQKVNSADVETKLTKINRELDLLWLVLLGGALGSFLHIAQSYSDYIGNQTLKRRWATWYYFRPLIGAALALVVYAAMRGGFMAITTGSSAKAAELNPFGVVSVAAMVGMFSKAATMKLGEIFDTVFKTTKADESKDKLVQAPQPASPPGGAPPGGGTGKR